MKAADNVDRFLTEAARLLTGQGWRIVDEAPAPFDMVAARDTAAFVVQTRVVLFFIDADTLSPEEIKKAMKQAHEMTGEAAQTPLFPATAIVVYIYSDAPSATTPEKKRDVARSHATVAWTVNLAAGALQIHHGAPLTRDGTRAIGQALNNVS